MDFPLSRLHNYQGYLFLVQVYCHAASHERQELSLKLMDYTSRILDKIICREYINPKECQTQSWNHS